MRSPPSWRLGIPRRCHGYRCFAGVRRSGRPRRSAASTTSGRTSACRSAAPWSRRARLTSIARSRSTCAPTPSCAARRCRTCAPPAAARSASPRPTRRCSRSRSSPPTPSRRRRRVALAQAGGARLQRRGHSRQRALPGLDRHAVQLARLGELRRPRALPRARFRGSCRSGRIGSPEEAGAPGLLPALRRRRVHDRARARRRRRRVPSRLSAPAALLRARRVRLSAARRASLPARQVLAAARAGRCRAAPSMCAARALPRAPSCCSRTRADWVERAERGELTRDEELRELGLPWSPELFERGHGARSARPWRRRTRRSRTAPRANLGGGTHHAFPGCGTRLLRLQRRRRRHALAAQAGGCGACSSSISTCTRATAPMPRWPATTRPSRARSTASATTRSSASPAISNATFPTARATTPISTRSRRCCPRRSSAPGAELCFYLAGADPFEGDRLGRLALTRAGLAARDRLVRSSLLRAGIPVCVTLAGGYAERIEDTVAINLATLRAFA